AAAPGPAAEDRIQDRAHKDFAKQECAESDAFADCADNDVAGCFHEYDFKQHQDIGTGVVPGSAKEKSLSADKAAHVFGHNREGIERGSAADLGGCRFERDAAPLKGITADVIG